MINSLSETTALEVSAALPSSALAALLDIQRGLTIEQASKATITQELGKKLGAATLHKLVCAVMRLFCVSLNLTQTMNAVQVYETAGFWLEQYPTESLKDLIMCLKLAKQSEYGKLYNRFDGEVFNDFWRKYMEQKAEYRENKWLDMKAKEASNEKLMLSQIATHAPQTAAILKTMIRPTPALASPIAPTHETYIDELKSRLPFAYLSELEKLQSEAINGGKATADILLMVNEEIAKRKEDIATTEAFAE